MDKQAYLIHGWGGEPDQGFRPWLKNALEEQGYTVVTPKLPNADRPNVDEQLKFIHELIPTTHAGIVIVGHSLGCNLILRFLATLPEGAVVGTTVLVAPAINEIVGLDANEAIIAAPWLADTIDANKAKRAGGKMTAIFSDNDPYIPPSTLDLLKHHYDMNVIVEHNRGHYSESDPVHEVPEILKAILEP